MMDMGIEISIHALREEGDGLTHYANDELLVISIHALREEGDLPIPGVFRDFQHFYPRPPRGGRPGAVQGQFLCPGISIHALREEGDWTGWKPRCRP